MPSIAIEKVDEKTDNASVSQEVSALFERIRKRAFEIFERREKNDASATEDWLKAEGEFLCPSESDVVEQDGHFDVRMKTADFRPADIRVIALPDAVIVTAASSYSHEENSNDVQLCDSAQKTLFRRFDFPEEINLDEVTAEMKHGLLHLTSAKATRRKVQIVKVASA